MAAVWLPEHGVIAPGAVGKLLHAELGRDPVVVERLLNEARAAASIDDPGVTPIGACASVSP